MSKRHLTPNYDEFGRFSRQGRALPYAFTDRVDGEERNMYKESIENKGFKILTAPEFSREMNGRD